MIQTDRLKSSASSVLLPVLLFGTVLLPGCNFDPDPLTAEEARTIVLIGMMNRNEEWERVRTTLFAPAKPRLFREKDSTLHFVLPDSLCGPNRNRLMARYIVDTNRLKWNWKKKGIMIVGALRARISPEEGCACRAKLSDLRIDSAAQLSFPYSVGEYRLSVAELAEWLENRGTYGGTTLEKAEKDLLLYYDYGLRVALPGEPSLGRLAEKIVSGIPKGEKHREQRVQAILNFVSREVEYDSLLKNKGPELRRRPYEILMMGRAEMTNQIILAASLLEQIDEDYLLAYSAGKEVFLVLPVGTFPNGNGHSFTWDKKNWTFCDTRIPGFRIGVDRSPNLPVFADISHVQRPRQKGVIVDPHTGKVFKTL